MRAGQIPQRLAPVLILLAPFVHFMSYYEYPLTSPSGLVGMGLFAVIGLALSQLWIKAGPWKKAIVAGFLLALYADIQFSLLISNILWFALAFLGAAAISRVLHEHIETLLTLVFATIIASTILLPSDAYHPFNKGTGQEIEGDVTKPAVLHIVLDEHMGVEGIANATADGAHMANQLKKLYLGRGFRLYGKAHSEYFYSKNSLSHMVNLAGAHEDGLAEGSSSTFKVRATRNRYFEKMAKDGYRIEAYQSDYMDFCGHAESAPPFCLTYRPFPVAFIKDQPWPTSEKLQTLMGYYLTHSAFYTTVRQGWYLLAAGGEKIGISLPAWNWEFSRSAPMGTLHLIDPLAQRLENASAGEIYFIHLLLPHSPYAFDAQCSLKPAHEWMERRDRVLPSAQANTPESRAQRYKSYVEQMACANTQVSKLIDAFESADIASGRVIMVHGDHGSRIATYDARVSRRDDLSPQDIVDNYSTLFAIKADDIDPGYDLSRASMQDLVEFYVKGDFKKPEAGHLWPAPVFHYTSIGKRVASEGQMPDFGNSQ